MQMPGSRARATRWIARLVAFALARRRAPDGGAPRPPEKGFVLPPPFADTEAVWAIVADGAAVPATTHHGVVATT